MNLILTFFLKIQSQAFSWMQMDSPELVRFSSLLREIYVLSVKFSYLTE